MKINLFLRDIYGKGFWPCTVALNILAFLYAGAEFLLTCQLGEIIDAVTQGQNQTLSHLGGILVIFLVFLLGMAAMTLLGGRMSASLACRLQVRIGEKLCRGRYRDVAEIGDGELLTMATKDVEGVKEWFSMLYRLGTLPAQLGLGIFPLIIYNWKFALAVLWLIPMAAIPELLISRKLDTFHKQEKNTYARTILFFTDTLERILAVKSFRLEEFLQGRHEEKLRDFQRAKITRKLREQLLDVYGRCYGHITNCLILFLGAWFILAGDMSLGMLSSVILLANLVGEGLKVLNAIPARLQNGRASVIHICRLLELPDESDRGTGCLQEASSSDLDFAPVYRAQKLSFAYGQRQVLQDISFEIYPGEKIAVVGPSGCGKTTLFKLLSGLYVPQEGQLYFKGRDLALLSPEKVRAAVTAVTQEAFLFHDTFRENIRLAHPGSTDRAVEESGKLAQIHDFLSSRPMGYDTVINTAVQMVSNGQMQRINLARAFLKSTDVILLDEPVSALDPDNARLVMDHFFESCQGKTMLVILHDLQEIHRFDKVLILESGKLAALGSHEQFLEE